MRSTPGPFSITPRAAQRLAALTTAAFCAAAAWDAPAVAAPTKAKKAAPAVSAVDPTLPTGEKVGAPRADKLGPPRFPKRREAAQYPLCALKEAGCARKACKAGYRNVTDDAAAPQKVYCALGGARLLELEEPVRLALLRSLGRRPPLPPPEARKPPPKLAPPPADVAPEEEDTPPDSQEESDGSGSAEGSESSEEQASPASDGSDSTSGSAEEEAASDTPPEAQDDGESE